MGLDFLFRNISDFNIKISNSEEVAEIEESNIGIRIYHKE